MNTELLLDLEVTLTVELGRKKMTIQDIMNSSHGTIIELSQSTKEPLTFFVNDKPFGKCEIVQFNNGKVGMKVLEIFKQSSNKK